MNKARDSILCDVRKVIVNFISPVKSVLIDGRLYRVMRSAYLKIDHKSSSNTGNDGITSSWNTSLENCLKRENQ